MEILNSTTGKVFEIKMIDPKTWCEKPTEEQLNQFPGIVAVMDGSLAEWLSRADEVLFSKREELRENDEYGECTQFDNGYHQYINGFDFNDTPKAIISFCENFTSYEN